MEQSNASSIRPLAQVRERPAPSGALRPSRATSALSRGPDVRERPAPSGALRHSVHVFGCACAARQGAPSTIRCIKTSTGPGSPYYRSPVREHSAPSGALRRARSTRWWGAGSPASGSTQHHQVRSRLCSIGAGRGPRPKCQGVEAGRCCGGASCGRAVSAPPVPFYPAMRTQGARIRQRRSHTRAGSSRCVRCCVA